MKKGKFLVLSTFLLSLVLSGCNGVNPFGSSSSSQTSTSSSLTSGSSNITSDETSSTNSSVNSSEVSSQVVSSEASSSETSSSEEVLGTVLKKRSVPLINKSIDYALINNSIDAYFYDNGQVPYIGVNEFIDSLNGYYDSDVIKSSKVDEVVTYSWTFEGAESDLTLSIDLANETMDVSSPAFFNFINSPEGISYERHSRFNGEYVEGDPQFTYDLKPYGYDITYLDNDVILPLSVINTVFLVNNIGSLNYSQNKFYFFSYYLEPKDYLSIRGDNENDGNIPLDVLEERNRSLFFTMDYLYGLKEHKKMTSFKSWLEETDPKTLENLYNPNTVINMNAIKRIYVTLLDDLHTTPLFRSMYSKAQEGWGYDYYYEDLGERRLRYNLENQDLAIYYNQAFGDTYEPLRIAGETGFIKFNQFMVGRDEELYDSEGKVLPTAYQYDTYYLFKKCLDEVRNYNVNKDQYSTVKYIVIDLSQNGGGTLSACIEALGFLTDKDVQIAYRELLAGIDSVERYKVDADDDGDYKDDDAYTEFKYYILTSDNTFSAANLFTSVCRDLGIAKIIGHKSGGGMCGVSTVPLLDGTTFNISGTFALSSAVQKGDTFVHSPIEDGVEVDYEIPTKSFYDLSYIGNMIHHLNETKN